MKGAHHAALLERHGNNNVPRGFRREGLNRVPVIRKEFPKTKKSGVPAGTFVIASRVVDPRFFSNFIRND